MGGRVAEELIFDELTTGASNDLERVTKIANDMIKRFGMSKSLGPRIFGKRQETVFLGREISEQQDYSQAVAEDIDKEVDALIVRAYDRAVEVLEEHKTKLVLLAEYLIDYESISGKELGVLLEGAR
jgi:cell division protease FtsH